MTRNALVKAISTTSDKLSLARGRRRAKGGRVLTKAEIHLSAKLTNLQSQLTKMDKASA